MKRLAALALAFSLGAAPSLFADVKYQEETQLKFSGALGTMMKLFGGSKPQVHTVYLKGNVLRTDAENGSKLIDLDKEAFIDIDHKKKEYSVLTFKELREQMQKAAEEAKRESEKQPESKPEVSNVKFNVSVKPTGQSQTFDGHKTDEAVVTLTIEGQDTSGNKGALVTNSDVWLAKDLKEYKEVENFYRRMGEKMGQEWMGGQANMWNMLSASNPELAESMKEMQKESRKLEGTPLVATTTFDVIGQPAKEGTSTQAEEGKQEEGTKLEKPSIGGLLGKLGKKKVEEKQKEKQAEKAKQGNRSNMMTATTKISGFSTGSLGADLFQIPAGYKEVKRKN